MSRHRAARHRPMHLERAAAPLLAASGTVAVAALTAVVLSGQDGPGGGPADAPPDDSRSSPAEARDPGLPADPLLPAGLSLDQAGAQGRSGRGLEGSGGQLGGLLARTTAAVHAAIQPGTGDLAGTAPSTAGGALPAVFSAPAGDVLPGTGVLPGAGGPPTPICAAAPAPGSGPAPVPGAIAAGPGTVGEVLPPAPPPEVLPGVVPPVSDTVGEVPDPGAPQPPSLAPAPAKPLPLPLPLSLPLPQGVDPVVDTVGEVLDPPRPTPGVPAPGSKPPALPAVVAEVVESKPAADVITSRPVTTVIESAPAAPEVSTEELTASLEQAGQLTGLIP